jgi:hypothetical protein
MVSGSIGNINPPCLVSVEMPKATAFVYAGTPITWTIFVRSQRLMNNDRCTAVE